MADTSKNVVVISMIVAGLVAVVAILDLTTGIPFSREHTMWMDIMFLICAAIVGFLGWDAYQDLQ